MHDDHAEVLLAGKETLADTEQVIFDLGVKRNAGPDAGVDEQVITFAVVGHQSFQKGDVLGR